MPRLTLINVGGDIVESVRLDESADPLPGSGDLLVAIEAAPVNPGDFLLAAGLYDFQPPVPFALGGEGVGRVLAEGPGTDSTLVGRRVLILPTYDQGTWADRLVVSAHNAVPVGDQADPLQLAMLVNAASAHVLPTGYQDLKPGDWVGLTLANSAVGQNVIGLAKRAGLRTLALVRRETAAERLRGLGADLVLSRAKISAPGPSRHLAATAYVCCWTASAVFEQAHWSARSTRAAWSWRSPPSPGNRPSCRSATSSTWGYPCTVSSSSTGSVRRHAPSGPPEPRGAMTT